MTSVMLIAYMFDIWCFDNQDKIYENMLFNFFYGWINKYFCDDRLQSCCQKYDIIATSWWPHSHRYINSMHSNIFLNIFWTFFIFFTWRKIYKKTKPSAIGGMVRGSLNTCVHDICLQILKKTAENRQQQRYQLNLIWVSLLW